MVKFEEERRHDFVEGLVGHANEAAAGFGGLQHSRPVARMPGVPQDAVQDPERK